jgi:hypothetical protein
MKKKIFILLFCFLSTFAFAQVKNNVKVNLADLWLRNISILYEKSISPKLSIQVQLTYGTKWLGRGGPTRDGGYRFFPEVRYYFKPDTSGFPYGFYTSAFAGFYHYRFSGKDALYSVGGGPFYGPGGYVFIDKGIWIMNGFGGGMLIGYQSRLIKGRGYTFDVFAGPQYFVPHIKFNAPGPALSNPTNLVPYKFGARVGFCIGKAF